MAEDNLSQKERETLLTIARESIEAVVLGKQLNRINLDEFSEALKDQGASFVTLTRDGQLRGCIGTLEPYQALVSDVQEHAIDSATQDYRFPAVKPEELGKITIEISRLTKPKRLHYDRSNELLTKLRPGIDGVVLMDGLRRATFLPQVWEKLSDPAEFLSHLCLKMGLPADTWRIKKMEILIYQVEEFHE